MRLFVATFLADEAQTWCVERIDAVLRSHARVLRSIPSRSAHLTHFFCASLGEVPFEPFAMSIERAALAVSPLTIRLGHLTTIPPGSRARLISADVVLGGAATMALSRTLSETVRRDWPALSIDASKSAHVTLLRFKKHVSPTETRAVAATLDHLNATSEAWATVLDHVDIVRSTLTDAGPVYDVLRRVPLGGPVGGPV
jgi:2'-5' RNA ligase